MAMLSNRKNFRNIILLLSVVLFGVAYFGFHKGQGVKREVRQKEFDRSALQQELENTARLSANLAELNTLTIDENDATRLNILRHLGLEQYDYDFDVVNRQVNQISEVELYVRQVNLSTQIAYPDTLALLDRLYNTGKLSITRIELKRSSEYGDKVALRMEGRMYALRKEGGGEDTMTEAEAGLPAEPQEAPQPEQPQEDMAVDDAAGPQPEQPLPAPETPAAMPAGDDDGEVPSVQDDTAVPAETVLTAPQEAAGAQPEETDETGEGQ